MKLRVRSVQSKQTLKIEVPNSCTFEQLEQTLCATLSCSSPSLRLSLNSKDELHPTSSQDTLQSLGITSGDLVYFTLNLDDRSPSNPSSSSSVQGRGQVLQGNLREPLLNNSVNFHESGELGSYVDEKQETLIGVQAGEVNCEESGLYESQMSQFASGGSNMNDTQMGEKLENHEVAALEGMDVDIDASSVVDVGDKKFSEPYFLRRVLREEFSGDGGKSKLLVTALHAVFLDSGFVSLDSSGRRVDQLNLPEEWPSKVFQLSLQYTLPELLGDENQNDTVVESVVLKLQSLGHFVNVYGNLSKGGSGPYCVCLDEDRFAPIIDVMWANCDKDDKLYEYDGLTRSYPENEVLQFWKIVKDGLALPLLIDLCENTGLALPSCFMRLPTELKLKILESLSGVDIAKMGSVCVEMRYLSSNNDLWKQKLEEEFGSGTVQQVVANWKERFAWRWETKKRHNEGANARGILSRPFRPFRPPLVIREPHPFPFLFARPQRRLPPFIRYRNFAPNCNLGGSNF